MEPVDKRVYTVASYDNFNILPELIDEYTGMVRGVVKNLYMNTTCYSTNAFARMKSGEALTEKKLTPRIHESREAAQKALKSEG